MYKLERYNQEYYYFSDKKDLFNQIDNLIKNQKIRYRTVLYTLNLYFTEEFKFFSGKGNFLIKEEKLDTRDEAGWIVYKTLYVNALWKIYKNGYVDDLSKLIEEYCQSRNIYEINNKFKYSRLSNGSKKENRKRNYRSLNINCTKEYKDSFYALEYNVKIRKQRLSEVKSLHVMDYDAYPRSTKSNCWKDQSKRKKQYKEPKQ